MRGLPLEGHHQRKSRKKLEQDVGFMNGSPTASSASAARLPAGLGEGSDQGQAGSLGYMLSGVDRQSGERLDDINIRYQMNTFLIAAMRPRAGCCPSHPTSC